MVLANYDAILLGTSKVEAGVKSSSGERSILQSLNGMAVGLGTGFERCLESYWPGVPVMSLHGDLTIQEHDIPLLLLDRSDGAMISSEQRVGSSEIEGRVVNTQMVLGPVASRVQHEKIDEATIGFVVPGSDCGQSDAEFTRRYTASYRAQESRFLQPVEHRLDTESVTTGNGKPEKWLARNSWLGSSQMISVSMTIGSCSTKLTHCARNLERAMHRRQLQNIPNRGI